MSLIRHDIPSRWDWVGFCLTLSRRMLAVAQAMAARGIGGSRDVALRWRRPAAGLFLCITVTTAALAGIGFYRIYLDRTNLPGLEPFVRFDYPTIGHIYDTNGQPLMEIATEYRWISKYEDIPPVVRGAILAAEDKNFFSHSGVDYSGIPRVLGKLRIRSLLGRLTKLGRRDAVNSSPIFPQGGSTITQQHHSTARTRLFSSSRDGSRKQQPAPAQRTFGSRPVVSDRRAKRQRGGSEGRGDPASAVARKEMRERFGSKRRAKEEILARYVSLVYMGPLAGRGGDGFGNQDVTKGWSDPI